MLKRLGSAIPAEADRLLPDGQRNPLPDDCLPFSNGRAALAWIIQHGCRLSCYESRDWHVLNFRSAMICAYSCPSLLEFLRDKGLQVGLFDAGDHDGLVRGVRGTLESPCLILAPPPRRDFQLSLPNPQDLIIIDAMQTAFGHLDYADGWVLSGPRKTTACLDGAILRFPGASKYRREIMDLKTAAQSVAWMALAHQYWGEGHDDVARPLYRCGEESWPERPVRMHEESINWLERLDWQWHQARRRDNFDRMFRWLGSKLPIVSTCGRAPFSFPVLVNNPNELVEYLKAQRIYASRLWHDAEHDPQKHKRTHILTRHLVSLPIDQRCEPHGIDRIARAVLEIAKPMEVNDERKAAQTSPGPL